METRLEDCWVVSVKPLGGYWQTFGEYKTKIAADDVADKLWQYKGVQLTGTYVYKFRRIEVRKQ